MQNHSIELTILQLCVASCHAVSAVCSGTFVTNLSRAKVPIGLMIERGQQLAFPNCGQITPRLGQSPLQPLQSDVLQSERE
jgi:hypothetical protein